MIAAYRKLAYGERTIEQNIDPFRTQGGWKSLELDFHNTCLTVLTLSPYLAGIAAWKTTPLDHSSFTLNCRPRIKQYSSALSQLGPLIADVLRLFLTDLEFCWNTASISQPSCLWILMDCGRIPMDCRIYSATLNVAKHILIGISIQLVHFLYSLNRLYKPGLIPPLE
jgi:hypothetical protein